MRDNLIAVAVAAALFCGLYALFLALSIPAPQPPQKNAPEPRSVVVWV
jgi:hypothetical protein